MVVGNANELNGAYSADGYARVKGAPGVCIASLGIALTGSGHNLWRWRALSYQWDRRSVCGTVAHYPHRW
jgi:hypothetical protein